MSDMKVEPKDWHKIIDYLIVHPEIHTRFFKSIDRYMRDEKEAVKEYSHMLGELQRLGAPVQLTEMFKHLIIDEYNHHRLLEKIRVQKEYM